ncbi:hypothetical protein ACSKF1_05740 [Lactiplantibacillus plantarum]|uniref:hypothetical protein n=1 Tax=Lactiplantibacillus plantarum TaxID=1590 RepID=UPI003F655EA7
MTKYDNVREVLKFLIEYNDTGLNPDLKSRTNGGEWMPSTAKDVQEVNYEALTQAADMLGMSDLYLEEKRHEN